MDTNAYDSERRTDTETVGRAQRTWTEPGDSIAVAIAELVGKVVGTDPVDLPPLNHHVDADALESVFRSPAGGSGSVRGLVEFSYVDCQVRVYSDGEVVVKRDPTA